MMGSFSASRISRADRSRGFGRLGGLGFATAPRTPASDFGGFTGLATGAFPPASWRTGGVAEGGLTFDFFDGETIGWFSFASTSTGSGLVIRSGSGAAVGLATTGGLGIGLRAATTGFTVGATSVVSPDKNRNSNSPPNPRDTAQATSIGETVSRRNMHWNRTSLTRETASSPSFQPPAASST